MTDNPSPEMLQARDAARQKVDDTYHDAAEAFQRIRHAYDNIGASKSILGTSERIKLYNVLAGAQAEYQLRREDHSKALVAYHEYFQPIQDAGGGV